MQLGLVTGTATATVKHPSLEGWRLLVVQPLSADGRAPDGDPVLAIDHLGAARGQSVIISNDGKWTRELLKSETTPARWAVIGLPDAERTKANTAKP
jgi:ethanolamine utilization protein EutN